jgi:hypothetical protein
MSPMSTALPHIDVCTCTYRRPRLLQRLLEALRDANQSGRPGRDRTDGPITDTVDFP